MAKMPIMVKKENNMFIYESTIYKKTIQQLANQLPKKNATVLVTGACGLIGSCIVETLLNAGYKVYALELKKEKLIARFGQENDQLKFIEQNICEDLDNNLELDYIVHAASFADPRSYALYPAETILTNVVGARTVLNYCKNHLNCRALLTSTFEVYGKLDQDVYQEDQFGLIDYNQVRSCYPESKRTAEILFRSYHEEYGVDCVIIRFASIYGPTMLSNDSKAHAQFLFKAMQNEDIVLKSEGKQKRTYCYVMDAVSGLFKVLFEGKTGEAYNIANSKSIATISEVAHTIADLVGVKVVYDLPDEIERKGFSKPQNCVLDVSKLESLGWEGQYSLIEGMKETLAILKEIK